MKKEQQKKTNIKIILGSTRKGRTSDKIGNALKSIADKRSDITTEILDLADFNLPFLNDEIVLVGHSMGGSFLAKYLSENKFPKKIKGAFLVSAVYNKDSEGYGLLSFALSEKINLQTEKIVRNAPPQMRKRNAICQSFMLSNY